MTDVLFEVEFGRLDQRLQMGDADHPPSPTAPEPPQASTRPQRNGCVTAFLVLVGVVLLLPGLCTMVFFGNGLASTPIGGITLVIALGGIALIVAALVREGG